MSGVLKLGRSKVQTWPYVMILPAFILYAVFRLYPVVYGVVISLTEWNGLAAMKFVGLANYQELIKDEIFRLALKNNILYTIFTVLGKNALGLVLALLLNKRLKGMVFYRSILFMPVVMSFVVVGILWSWILNPAFGLLNGVLQKLGLSFLILDWLSDPNVALYSVMGVDIWKWTGFHMVIFLAGLQSIPESLYEAGRIDGIRTTWQEVRYITLPLLAPVTLVNVLMSLIGGFQVFDLIYVITAGGPAHATEVIMTHMYTVAFKFHRMGYAAAVSYGLFVIILIVSLIQIRLMRSERYEF